MRRGIMQRVIEIKNPNRILPHKTATQRGLASFFTDKSQLNNLTFISNSLKLNLLAFDQRTHTFIGQNF